MPVGYSYVRYSTPRQAEGDSLRRQTAKAAEWCKRNGVKLDTSLSFQDLGRSAYLGEHRKNPDRHALAAFLKMVEDRRIPSGSALILESLDRLSREHIRPALTLLLNLIEAGVRVVQLTPVEQVYDADVEPMALMLAIVELSRGHSESAVKGERVGAAWTEKRRRARDEGHILTKKLPAWVDYRDGKLILDARKAATVRQVFALAAAGRGHSLILQKMIADGVPAIGAGRWSRSYVAKILRDRRAIGELQPRTRDGKPDGPPVPGYYPSVITEQEYHAARAGAAERRKRPGGLGRNVNVFSGLLHEAGGGPPFYLLNRTGSDCGRPVKVTLLTTAEHAKGTTAVSVRYPEFEAAVLGRMREVDPRSVVGANDDATDLAALAGELSELDNRIGRLERELETGDVEALARVLRRLEEQRRGVAERLAEARQRAASPVGEAFGEVKTLAEVIAKAENPDDTRLRLRSVLRRVVERMHLAVVRRGAWKLAALQVDFRESTVRRTYLLAFRRGHASEVLSVAADLSTLDLRKPADVAKVGKLLARLDLAAG